MPEKRMILKTLIHVNNVWHIHSRLHQLCRFSGPACVLALICSLKKLSNNNYSICHHFRYDRKSYLAIFSCSGRRKRDFVWSPVMSFSAVPLPVWSWHCASHISGSISLIAVEDICQQSTYVKRWKGNRNIRSSGTSGIREVAKDDKESHRSTWCLFPNSQSHS